MKKMIVAVTSLLCLTAIVISSHVQGFDGTLTSSVVGLMGVIAGYMLKRKKDSSNGNNEKI